MNEDHSSALTYEWLLSTLSCTEPNFALRCIATHRTCTTLLSTTYYCIVVPNNHCTIFTIIVICNCNWCLTSSQIYARRLLAAMSKYPFTDRRRFFPVHQSTIVACSKPCCLPNQKQSQQNVESSSFVNSQKVSC